MSRTSIDFFKSAWLAALAVLAITSASAESVRADVTVAGDLIVDLRAVDLDAGSTTWVNRSTSADSVGDFMTVGGGNTNVVIDKSDGNVISNALEIDSDVNNSMISALETPASVEGNESRSVEVWLWSNNPGPGEQSPVSWGTTGNGEYSNFRYSNSTSNGKWSGWFIDSGWEGLTSRQWVHVAYTYDGTDMKGYLDGVLFDTDTLTGLSNHPLITSSNVISIGSGNGGTRDVFGGFIGDVRVHTGVLSESDVANNYAQGVSIIPEPSACVLSGFALMRIVIQRRK